MNMIDVLMPEDQYHKEEVTKDLIVLHHTSGGSAMSSIDWWKSNPDKIGVAYVVDRNGDVLRAFPDQYWASHLGLKNVPQGELDRRSIGIEIACAGGLRKGPDGILRAFDKLTGPSFGGIRSVLTATWRGYSVFEAYTPEQVDSVITLTRMLLDKYTIPGQTPLAKNTYLMPGLRTYKGVVTHCQLRDDKSDCHPGFPWDLFISKAMLTQTT